jgi:aldehyde dehydrogenase (NAD+)
MAGLSIKQEVESILTQLGVPATAYNSGDLQVHSPITGELIASVKSDTASVAADTIAAAHAAFLEWRSVPAPRRGELVRLLGEELRQALPELGRLVTIETGKLLTEGMGEVQEMIDICAFATGLSRQLAGLSLPSERKDHRILETWHPLGAVGVITAFNFPVAVWAWNSALAFVCGDAVVWKPSEKTPLTALAVQSLFGRAAEKFGGVPAGLSGLLIGDARLGEQLVESPLLPLISATGSTAMGRRVAPVVAGRFGRAILELGGNNAAIVCPSANLELALRAIAFSAMGTAGQRCTSLRRLIVHESIYETFLAQLKRAYASVVVGDPRDVGTLVGPLIDERAWINMQNALEEARGVGASVMGGTRALMKMPQAYYAHPALVEISAQANVVKRETFAPILYVMRYSTLQEAIAIQNDVAQGLSSAIFTLNMQEAEQFLSATGSDCGIANVNIGTSGAEIGGAFGGEKETGGGRESGSDAWKQYMRRATNTINYGDSLPLAQGVSFDIA